MTSRSDRTRIPAAALVLIFSCTLAACATPPASNVRRVGPKGRSPAPFTARSLIGVSLRQRTSQFYGDMDIGIRDEAAKLGYTVTLDDAERDAAKQARQIQGFLERGVAAIVIVPVDASKIGASITKANQANVPVFTVDIAAEGRGAVVSHVASDNWQGGELAGAMMCRAVPRNGAVAILDTKTSVSSVRDRVEGFQTALARCNSTTPIIDRQGDKRDDSYRATKRILQEVSHLAGIFSFNDDSAIAASYAVDQAGLGRAVSIIGYDATPEAREAVMAGKMYGAIVQHADMIGAAAIDTVHRHLGGERLPSAIPVPVDSFTRADGGLSARFGGAGRTR